MRAARVRLRVPKALIMLLVSAMGVAGFCGLYLLVNR